jgi:hypothetical protein
MFFQNPPYRASRQLLIPRIAVVGTSFSPLPCHAWHGYKVNSAHHVEVEVGADGPANAPPSGAAAAAPPAGAKFHACPNKTIQPTHGPIRPSIKAHATGLAHQISYARIRMVALRNAIVLADACCRYFYWRYSLLP